MQRDVRKPRTAAIGLVAIWGAAFFAGWCGAAVAAPQRRPAPPSVSPAACAKVDREDALKLLASWQTAVSSGDVGALADRYAVDAALLPAEATTPATSPAARQVALAAFLADAPKIAIERRTTQIGCRLVADTGIYTITRPRSGGLEPELIRQQFMLVYEQRGGRWRILHHHVRAVEAPVAPRAGLAPLVFPAQLIAASVSAGPTAGMVTTASAPPARSEAVTLPKGRAPARGSTGTTRQVHPSLWTHLPAVWDNNTPVFQSDRRRLAQR